ncbi:hypothetical protein NM688_g8219 [Phlebia brevispora]|uniref:Uncharacterized protein n=1 Tax=Phlebia brevispora TaxID=194682 RepID=A0ACC1RVR8_9APHY|nr:hypothetical protein NM688_g8219 [Phlebia brevispora]
MWQARVTDFQQQPTEGIPNLSEPEGELSNEFLNLDFSPSTAFDQEQPAVANYGGSDATAWSALTSAFGDEFGQSSTVPTASWGDLPLDQGDELSAHKPPFWPMADAYGSSYEEGSMASFDAFPTVGTGYGGFPQYPLNDSFFENMH